MTAQNTVINNSITNINNTVDEHYAKEDAAISNIDNQSSSDVQGSDSQQTTNLIGVLSNFLTQLRSFSATNCNLSLPFPQFIGELRLSISVKVKMFWVILLLLLDL